MREDQTYLADDLQQPRMTTLDSVANERDVLHDSAKAEHLCDPL